MAPLLSIWLVSLGIALMSARNTVDTILDDGLSSAVTVLNAEWQASKSIDVNAKFPSDATRTWMNIAPQTPMTYLIVDDANVPQSGDPDLLQLLRETTDSDLKMATTTAGCLVDIAGKNSISGTLNE